MTMAPPKVSDAKLLAEWALTLMPRDNVPPSIRAAAHSILSGGEQADAEVEELVRAADVGMQYLLVHDGFVPEQTISDLSNALVAVRNRAKGRER